MNGLKRMVGSASALLVVVSVAGCANTAQGVKTDTERAVENVSAGMETMDVKGALIADGRVDASKINVDTNAESRTVVLKGSVPSAEHKTMAEEIARREAKDYKIENQLTIAPEN